MSEKIAVIIGAGPAGLTAAYELLDKTDIKPIIYEMTDSVGGICRTVNYKGNRMDIGGHRFFSRSDRVVRWWQQILPLQGLNGGESSVLEIAYEGKKKHLRLSYGGPDPKKTDKVMLVRDRRSRIYFLRKFFDYPISFAWATFRDLGFIRSFKIIFSYVITHLFPIRPEKSLRDFLINRFGTELYLTFFRSYTKKVWGVPCHRMTAEWGAQRIKGLSLLKAILGQVKGIVSKDPTMMQRHVEPSLIQKFMYPKYGPGQMWEEAARIVEEKGGEIHKNFEAVGLKTQEGEIVEVQLKERTSGELKTQRLDYLFSTMPVKNLIRCFGEAAPPEVVRVSRGLMYRDFITVGVLLKKLKHKEQNGSKTTNGLYPDNWIYVQERDVRVGRIQIYNNWSPYLVKDKNTVWIGMEYFVKEGGALWVQSDSEIVKFATEELVKLDLIDREDVLDNTLIRMLKTYPGYFGTYDEFHVIRNYTDQFENLFLIGRNGMHKYNNQDHSMLTAMVAVENIVNGVKPKDNIWAVNTEQEYQETK